MITRNRDTGGALLDEIEDQAIEWIVLTDQNRSTECWKDLDAWLARSAAHRAAYLRALALWKELDLLRAPSTKRHAATDFVTSGVPGLWRSFGAFATSRPMASLTVLAITILGSLGAWYSMKQKAEQVYSTHIGEFHRVVLADGSTIALNTDSEVRVSYSSNYRHVDLTRGEALFQVAKNKARPFDVEAGSTTVRAVGTAFSVRLHEAGANELVDVIVSEGRIAINPSSAQTYAAGTIAIVREGRVEATVGDVEDIRGKLTWTTGHLTFRGEKLSDVVEEMNRYNSRKLQISDPHIESLHIGGTFDAKDPDGFAQALGATYGIKARLVTKSFGADVIRLDSGVP